MRVVAWLAALLAGACNDVGTQPTPTGSSAAVAFTNTRILTMDGRGVLEGHTVVAVDGRITGLGPDGSVAVPEDARVIEGDGDWLMPGLIDSHVHPRAFTAWPADWNRTSLLYLANGITSIVGMGDFTGAMRDVARDVRTGALRGPTVYLGHFARGTRDGGSAATIAGSPEAGRALVRRAADQGYDFVKVYHGLDAQVFNAIADEARTVGIPVLGHIVLSIGWEAEALAGHRMAVHATTLLLRGTNLQPTLAEIRAMAGAVGTRDIAVGSTLLAGVTSNTWSLLALSGQDPWDYVLAQPGVEYLTPAALETWRSMLQQRPEIHNPVDRTTIVEASFAFVKALVDAGVPLMIGSDDVGIPGIVPGFGFHQEIAQVAATGVDSWDVLRAATLWPGRFLGTEMRLNDVVGTVRVGARADLLLLDRDPRADLGALREARGVLANGVWHDGASLRAELAGLAGR